MHTVMDERSAWRRSSHVEEENDEEDEDGTSWAWRELEQLCSKKTVLYKVQHLHQRHGQERNCPRPLFAHSEAAGTAGMTGERLLDQDMLSKAAGSEERQLFPRGSKVTFMFHADDIGRPSRMLVRFLPNGEEPSWYLERIVMWRAKAFNEKVAFPAYSWFDGEIADTWDQEFSASGRAAREQGGEGFSCVAGDSPCKRRRGRVGARVQQAAERGGGDKVRGMMLGRNSLTESRALELLREVILPSYLILVSVLVSAPSPVLVSVLVLIFP
eukprot:767338-Hanusia_phi.AAC.3